MYVPSGTTTGELVPSTFIRKTFSCEVPDKKNSLDKSSFDVLPFKIAGFDANPFAVPEAVDATVVAVPKPNKALVPPIPVSLEVATPAEIASLPISILDAVVVAATPTAPSARIFSPVVALLIVNLLRLELYETVTP